MRRVRDLNIGYVFILSINSMPKQFYNNREWRVWAVECGNILVEEVRKIG